MGVIKSVSNVWHGLKSMANMPTDKSWDDTLVAIRDGNYEEWTKPENASSFNPYQSNYTVQRGISLLATNVAQVPLQLFKNDQLLNEGFQFYDVLQKPNEYTSGFELWEQTLIYFYLYGESFWFLNTNEFGFVKEIYVLHPKFVKHYQESPSSPVSNWVFNDTVPMTTEQVIHFKLFDTTGIRGLSPIDSVKFDLNADKEAAIYNRNFFKNGSRVNGMITLDKEMSTTTQEMKSVLGRFKKDHQGSSNAYKVGILSPGMKYDEYGQTMRDMEYIAGRDAIRDRILLVLGIHKSIVGITDKIDRATADVALRSLWQTNLKPNCVRIQEKLNAELFAVFYPGVKCKFDFSKVEELKKDLNATLDAATKLFMMGFTRNEVNERLSLEMPESTEDGDTRYVPINLVPVEARIYEDNNDSKEVEPTLAVKKDKSITKDYRSRFLRVQSGQEKAFEKKLKSYFVLQRGKVIKALVGTKSIEEINKITVRLDELIDKENARLENAIMPFYKQAGEAGLALAYETLGVDKEPLISESILLDRANKVKSVNTTVFNQIKMEITEGVEAGETIDQLSNRVKDVYEFMDKTQATKIARTETSSMISQTNLQAYKEEGVPMKQWLTAKDGKVRDEHAANGAQGPIPVNQPFANGENYPGENSVNCRCAIAPVVRS